MGLGDRLKHAWNAFRNESAYSYSEIGPSFYMRPDRPRFSKGNERSIVTSILNRIAMDAASIDIQHVRLDEDDQFVGVIHSKLNNCLRIEANLDQSGRAMIHDAVLSMLDEGCVAIVPTDTDINPKKSGGYDILTMRTAKIVEWYPRDVKVKLYNEDDGKYHEIIMPKRVVAIVENPLYAVINEPNSTMQRLMHKLVLLDAVDEETGSGKLNMIIQLPYVIKGEQRRLQAETRRKDLETQLAQSKYGVAYADGTEKIIQINRPLENNLLAQIEYLTSMLYSQLGVTAEVLNGTATEEVMTNYYSRTIEPIVAAITDEMTRKFLTKTARTKHEAIKFFRDPFTLVPVTGIAEIADTFTRNAIMTSNELRQVIGMKPSADSIADELSNKNLYPTDEPVSEVTDDPIEDPESEIADLEDLDSQLDDLESMLQRDRSPAVVHTQYASPYYDPVKAHEYYMKTRELKGRSQSSLNEQGRAAAKVVKENLTNERKEKQSDYRNQIKTNNSNAKNTINAHRTHTQNSIQQMRDQTDAAIERQQVSTQSEIDSHKTETQNKIDQLRNRLKGMSTLQKQKNSNKIRAQIEQLRDENNEIIAQLRSTNDANIGKLRDENAQYRGEMQTEHNDYKDQVRAETVEVNDEIREQAAALKEEYEKKYNDELEKILSDPAFLKEEEEKKEKSSGSSKAKGGSSKDKNTKRKSSSYTGSKSTIGELRKKYGK